MTNKYGLSRNIPVEVKRKVRKRCGFGCVLCGLGIYTYEHINPEFAEAKVHDSEKITLLCGSCHLKVTKGIWSKDKVVAGNKNPFCITYKKSHEYFDAQSPFGVSIGRIYYYKNVSGELLKVENEPLLSLQLITGEPPKLSGFFFDKEDKEIFRIIENEWSGNLNAWDIESIGKKLIIRGNDKKILLQICAKPPNIIAVEKIDMMYKGCGLKTDEISGQITIETPITKHIDVSSGVVATEGALVLNREGFAFQGGSIIMLAQPDTPLNPLDFQKLLDTGRIVSI